MTTGNHPTSSNSNAGEILLGLDDVLNLTEQKGVVGTMSRKSSVVQRNSNVLTTSTSLKKQQPRNSSMKHGKGGDELAAVGLTDLERSSRHAQPGAVRVQGLGAATLQDDDEDHHALDADMEQALPPQQQPWEDSSGGDGNGGVHNSGVTANTTNTSSTTTTTFVEAKKVDDMADEIKQQIIESAPVGKVVELEDSQTEGIMSRRCLLIMGCFAVVAVVVVVVAVVVPRSNNNEDSNSSSSSENAFANELLDLLTTSSMEAFNETDPGRLALSNTNSPQYQAYEWIVESQEHGKIGKDQGENKGDKGKNKGVDDSDVNPRLEQYALATLYFSTGGDTTWTRTSSTTGLEQAFLGGSGAHCSWLVDKTHCSSITGAVTAIDLSGFNLTGTLPEELVFLEALEMLDLSVNSLYGFMPELLGKSPLAFVDLSDNNLVGDIPTTWDGTNAMASLRYLNVSSNELGEPLPDTLYQLFSLETLSVGGNPLKGSISSHIDSLTSLKTLSIKESSISGVIPESIANVTTLETLHLGGSMHISGTIPSSIWRLPALKSLDLSSIGFPVPLDSLDLASATSLEFLDLSNGLLMGAIPSSVGQMANLTSLNLSKNSLLQGTLPTELARLTRLQVFNLDLNGGITGTIPSEIGLMTALETWSTYRAALTGQIPAEIGQATNLKTFNLKANQLSTSISSEIGNLTAMENFIVLDQFVMFGTIPTEVGLMKSLKVFEAGDGDLVGTLPTEFGNLLQMEEMMIVRSKIEGTIPEQFGQLRNMKQIKLDMNDLSGTIPVSLSSMTDLEIFDVGGNAGISGTFPRAFTTWSSLKIGKIGGTNITGTVAPLICDSFNGGRWYGFYADCAEFDDGCECCTHCCPNEASFRSCTNDGPSADRYNEDELRPKGPPGGPGPGGPGPPGDGTGEDGPPEDDEAEEDSPPDPFGPSDKPPNNW